MNPEDPIGWLRLAGPGALALLAALTVDRLTARRGLLPPGFVQQPWRRTTATLLIAAIFWLGVFAPLGQLGTGFEPNLEEMTIPALFILHTVLVGTLVAWFLLGYAGVSRRPAAPPPAATEPAEPAGPIEAAVPGPSEAPVTPPPPPIPRWSLVELFARQFGLAAPSVPREVGAGVALGLAAWVAVLAAIFTIGAILVAFGGEDAVPQQPPSLVPWIAGLPVAVRILISLSAGVVEEVFFRGFLQPRVGIALSTALFAIAHFSYGQPFMLVGITLLSLVYAAIVRWRQNVWPAIAAHALFDGIQLLVIIPFVLRATGLEGGGGTALLP
jgi:membrane protease YdiL (CAAX protease family)